MPGSSETGIWRSALTLGLAVGVFGVSFGVLAMAAGLDVGQAAALSVLVFAGGSQFAAVGVVAAGGSPFAGVAAGLLLNSRYAAFGLAVAPRLGGGSLPRRLLAAHLVIDESSALALAQPDDHSAMRAFWATGAAVFVLWNAGTLLGALAGGALGDPRALGLDAAFPAGFLALLGPQLRRRAGRLAAAGGVIIAIALLPVAPPGVPILVAALGVLPALMLHGRGGEKVAV